MYFDVTGVAVVAMLIVVICSQEKSTSYEEACNSTKVAEFYSVAETEKFSGTIASQRLDVV